MSSDVKQDPFQACMTLNTMLSDVWTGSWKNLPQLRGFFHAYISNMIEIINLFQIKHPICMHSGARPKMPLNFPGGPSQMAVGNPPQTFSRWCDKLDMSCFHERFGERTELHTQPVNSCQNQSGVKMQTRNNSISFFCLQICLCQACVIDLPAIWLQYMD